MNVFEAINKRHSYRGPYADKIPAKEDLKKIVQAGLQAPSGCNQQTTQFVIIDDQDLVKQIGVLHPKNIAVQQAKAFIVCIVSKEPEPAYEGMSFEIEDCAAAVENMLLAITALGYASVWVDGWLRVDNRAQKISRMINLPNDKIIRILLPIGVPKEEHKQREKKPFSERAWFNRYKV